MARSGRAVPWPTLAWLGVFAAIGLYAQRGLAWWALAGAVAVIGLLPRSADAPEPVTTPTLRRLNVVVAAVLVLAGIALLPMWRPTDAGTRGSGGRPDGRAAGRDGCPPNGGATG